MIKIQGLSADQLEKIVKSIHLHLREARIFAFGSRVSGKPRKYSDLDIALDAHCSIDLSQLTKIKNSLSETNIPIVIDIVDYHSISNDFKAIIDQQKIELT